MLQPASAYVPRAKTSGKAELDAEVARITEEAQFDRAGIALTNN